MDFELEEEQQMLRQAARDFFRAECDKAVLRELEAENDRLERMVAERDLELDVMKEINQKKW